MGVLAAKILFLKGELSNDYAALQWATANEHGNVTFMVERSLDQVNFETAGSLAGHGTDGSGGSYTFTDSKTAGTATYYRIVMTNNGLHVYSNVVMVGSGDMGFAVKILNNPFADKLVFNITAPEADKVTISFVDMYGRTITRQTQYVGRGLNDAQIYHLNNLPLGTYTLQVRYGDQVVSKRVLKM